MTKPTKIFWITDPHLNFLKPGESTLYANSIAQNAFPGDFVIITGDIAEGLSVTGFMRHWKSILNQRSVKLYFVLGNHDFYYSSISGVRTLMKKELSDAWLPSVGIAPIVQDKVCLIGHDGWYDGLYADWMNSRVWMNDYEIIQEFLPKLKPEKLNLIRDLAHEAAGHVSMQAEAAIEQGYKKIYVATHIPPFRENAVYNGKISDNHWMPHFSSKIMGDMILRLGTQHPEIEFVVLCGHSHGEAKFKPLVNVTSYTGFAEYRHRNIANVFEEST